MTLVEGIPVIEILPYGKFPLVGFFQKHFRYATDVDGTIVASSMHIPVAGFSCAEVELEECKRNHWMVMGGANMKVKAEGFIPPKSKRFPISYALDPAGLKEIFIFEFASQEPDARAVIWNGYEARGGRWECLGNNCVTWKLIGENEWRVWVYGGVEYPSMDSAQLRIKLLHDLPEN